MFVKARPSARRRTDRRAPAGSTHLSRRWPGCGRCGSGSHGPDGQRDGRGTDGASAGPAERVLPGDWWASQLYLAPAATRIARQVFARMLQDDPGWKRGYVDFAAALPRDGPPARRGRLASPGAGRPGRLGRSGGIGGRPRAMPRRSACSRTTRAGRSPGSTAARAPASARRPGSMPRATPRCATRSRAALARLHARAHDSYLHQVRRGPGVRLSPEGSPIPSVGGGCGLPPMERHD